MTQQHQTLRLTEDLAFKIFFSSNDPVLASLLKCFLPIGDDISDIEIMSWEDDNEEDIMIETPIQSPQPNLKDTTILPQTPSHKLIMLDLNVQLSNGKRVNIEMQTANEQYFKKRVMFYLARLHSDQMRKAESYQKLNPTYSLIFTTYSMFGTGLPECINQFSFLAHQNPSVEFSDDLLVVTAELNKLPAESFKFLDLREKWCYLLKHSDNLTEQAREYLSQDEELRMALEHLDRISRNDLPDMRKVSIEKARMDLQSKLVESRNEGKAEARHDIAMHMLQEGCSDSLISKATGISEAEINRLKK